MKQIGIVGIGGISQKVYLPYASDGGCLLASFHSKSSGFGIGGQSFWTG